MGSQSFLLMLMAVISARSLATTIIHQVLYLGQSLEKQLQHAQKKLKDERDQALLRSLCFGVLRHHQSLQWQAEQMMQRPDCKGLLTSLLEVGIFQIDYLRIPDYSAVGSTVEVAKSLKLPEKVVNGVLRRYLRERATWVQKRHDQHFSELPKWLEDMLSAQWGRLAINIQKAYQTQVPMVLRNNALQQSATEYVKELILAGIAVEPLFFKDALLLAQPIRKKKLPRWHEGVCSVQSICSQAVVEILQPQNDEVVMDVCAAPGNKSINIKQMAPFAARHCIEINSDRAGDMREQFKHYAVDANIIIGDATDANIWPTDMAFDAILLDVPCSTTGTIRRNPDVKWLRRKSDIQPLQALQEQLLDVAWDFLKRGGRLLYSTCSVLKQENEWQLKQWLTKHADAEPVPITLPFGMAQTVGWQVLPDEETADGFYYCLLRKK